jgi:hypothetical protein
MLLIDLTQRLRRWRKKQVTAAVVAVVVEMMNDRFRFAITECKQCAFTIPKARKKNTQSKSYRLPGRTGHSSESTRVLPASKSLRGTVAIPYGSLVSVGATGFISSVDSDIWVRGGGWWWWWVGVGGEGVVVVRAV